MSTEAPTANKHQALIEGLRAAADFLESRPDFPQFQIPQRLYFRAWDKAELQTLARNLGSFTKHFNDDRFELHKKFSAQFAIEVHADRDTICKKTVTWDCPDDESLLKLVEGEEVSHG